MLLWIECAATLLLAFSQRYWMTFFPFSREICTQPSPTVLLFSAFALLLSTVGIRISLPYYRRLPQDVWFGWSTGVLKERTPDLPILDPLFGLTYVPLFQPNKIRAGRMILRGMDSTAALTSCTCLLLVCVTLVVSCITGDSPNVLLGYAQLLALLAAVWSAAVLVGIRGITHKKTGRAPANEGGGRLFPGWVLQLPLLVLLYGLAASFLPLLYVSLDSTPVFGFTRVLYAFVRAGFLSVILYLLLHAPLKLALLATPRKPHLAPLTFYSIQILGYFVWLLLDAFPTA